MKKIGILGGTFDPVHNAHIELAQAALAQYQLDCVLLIPAGMPVRKLETTEASAEHRLHMLELACQDLPNICVSSIEVDKAQISYTIDTLRALKAQYGEASELFLILGEDTAADLGTWKDSHEIAELAQVLYAMRPGGEDTFVLPSGFEGHKLQMPARHLSSSCVRRLLCKGGTINAYVADEVKAYIEKHGLYGQSQ